VWLPDGVACVTQDSDILESCRPVDQRGGGRRHGESFFSDGAEVPRMLLQDAPAGASVDDLRTEGLPLLGSTHHRISPSGIDAACLDCSVA
jgi:hypothetical protein